jgi:branched chain amino acid efflux pump
MPPETLAEMRGTEMRGAEMRAAAIAVLPAAVAVVPFGLLLGALAAQKGISVPEMMLMSATVFAGSAQFVAVEIWREPVPWLLLTVTALMINLRHLLMGASLAGKIHHFGRGASLIALFTMVDETWALCEQRAARTKLSATYMLTMGAILWLNWVGWTSLGAALGGLIGDPARFGADFAFPAIFLTLLVGLWQGPRTGVAIAASAIVAALVHLSVDGPWYIAAGGIAGALAGAFCAPSDEAIVEAGE